MKKSVPGYGSEWHLLRYLGYHRAVLSEKVKNVVGGESVEWLDFPFSEGKATARQDREFVGLEFVEKVEVRKKWESFWPQSGTAQNWDAVGRVRFKEKTEWVLVEAKGHIQELKSSCRAADPRSRTIILRALEKTSSALGLNSAEMGHRLSKWFEEYYQYANRLAVLYFLMKECEPAEEARLLFIYFYGEKRTDCTCPQSAKEWHESVREMTKSLGLDERNELMQRVHHLFLPVNPGRAEKASL